MDINPVKELTLTPKQTGWLMTRDFSDDAQWIVDGVESRQENEELKIQVVITGESTYRITTWE